MKTIPEVQRETFPTPHECMMGEGNRRAPQELRKPFLAWMIGLCLLFGTGPSFGSSSDTLHLISVGHQPFSIFPQITAKLTVNTERGLHCNLLKGDFDVTEDSVLQEIDSVTCISQSSLIVDMVMLLDTTGSMYDDLQMMATNSTALADEISSRGINARYGLISFRDDVRVELPLTSDEKAFVKAMKNLAGLSRKLPSPNDRHLACPESSVDAVLAAIDRMQYREEAQKVFVLMTDEESNVVSNGGGTHTMEETVERLKDAGVRVFTVSSSPDNVPSLNSLNDPRALAEKTGGIWLDILYADFTQIRDRIMAILSSFYWIKYTTSNPARDGTVRHVCVKVVEPEIGSSVDCGDYTAPCLGDSLDGFYPPNGATSIPINVVLQWTPPCKESTLYFGTNFSPTKAVYTGEQVSWNAGPLKYDTVYYWRVGWDASQCPCPGGTSGVLSFRTCPPPTPTPTPALCGLFSVRLNGAAETPPNSSAASGMGYFVIDPYYNTVAYTITCEGLASGAETAANIHGLAPPGFTAPPLYSLPLGNHKTGVWTFDESLESGLLDGNVYVNICTSEYPAGEIRAQIHRSEAGPVLFDFENSQEGWFSGGSPPFVAPTPRFVPGRLSLVSSDNTNTFGFWESPLIVFCRSPWNFNPGEIILPNDHYNDPCFLFRSLFSLSSDTSDSLRVPIIRYRSSSESFEQSDVLVATSVGSSDFSPQPGGRWYTHYFTIPLNQSGFRLDFDLLNMDPKDSPNAIVSLEQFEVEGVAWDSLGASREEKKYSFIGDALDWTPRTAATMREPLFEVNTFGLQIRGAPLESEESVDSIVFGYWSSSETASDAVKLEGNRLYRATFRVASDAGSSRRVCVPAFRLRVNDSSMRSCAYVNVESRYDDSRVPAGGKFESYYVYCYVPPQMAGGRLVLSFDYLYVPGGQNDPTIAIRMPWVEVESFALPGATP